jgi:hypothetical protein
LLSITPQTGSVSERNRLNTSMEAPSFGTMVRRKTRNARSSGMPACRASDTSLPTKRRSPARRAMGPSLSVTGMGKESPWIAGLPA